MKHWVRNALVIAFLLALTAGGSAAAQSEGPVYIVQPGDTLTAIAIRFGTTVEEIVAANDLEDASRLFPGMELTIPGFGGLSGYFATQELEPGQSLQSIGYENNIPLETLYVLNHVTNPQRVYAGQAINIIDASLDEAPARVLPRAQITLAATSRLELAAEAGVSPWQVEHKLDEPFRYWSLPGVVYVQDGAERDSWLPAPLRDLVIDPQIPQQGDTVVVGLQYDQPVYVEGSLNDHALEFFPQDGYEALALQGIHALTEPGLQDFEIWVYPAEGEQLIYGISQPILVEDGGYGFQRIAGVPPETVDPENTEPEQAFIDELLSVKTDEKFWDGPFEFPSKYYVKDFLSTFGMRRDYNNGALYYYHSGLDFYGADFPIHAPANGRVVFTGPLTVRGNATYIDHGWGVYSGYLHQSEINVSEGDFVQAGDVIGRVGNTGRATGPHLHWEIWVGGVPVDPLPWVERGYP
jgi:murein DD-endopeptidase MepM/ murein hydrolase activator NlpD